jgi:carboxyl-terminal processing protease
VIGVTVTGGTITIDGVEYDVIDVIDVVESSPAALAGVKTGDKIAWIGSADSNKLVGEMSGYAEAVNSLLGEAGTAAEFGVFRENGSGYEKIFFSVIRKYIERPTVTYSVSSTDSKVGIVRITQFNYSTPRQFVVALDSLLLSGCENIVFDVRGNPGGSLDSVVAVLSYLLPLGTTILSTVDVTGVYEVVKVAPVTTLEGEAASCNVAEQDIGKYSQKIKKMAVLCNGESASAAELFAANFRDHSLGILVGEKTYGKGSMQSVLSLASYGFAGGLRLTTRMYFPPCGEGYDGIGLYPTENYNISLSEEAKGYSLDMLPESLDDQLLSAIRSFD